MKTLLSGVQPTGRVHIGNFVGAIEPFVHIQGEYESFLFIADLHTLTSTKELSEKVGGLGKELLLDYLALGVDPNSTSIYFQSDIPEISEIFWILSNFIYVPTLLMGHKYKEISERKKEIGAGVLLYPVLMASDILAVGADIVPVGKDQYQHIELAREIAKRVNSRGEEVLKIPEVLKTDTAELVGTDGRKMSKAYDNTIPLFEGEDVIRAKVMSIVSDSTPKGSPLNTESDITFSYHKIFSVDMLDKIKTDYETGAIGFKESKELLAENIISSMKPKYELRKEYENSPTKLKEILEKGTAKAKERAKETLAKLKKATGIVGSGIIK